MQTWLPRGVAFLALEAPTTNGHWAMRGALTQGDLSSWVVAGSYQRAPATHRYDAGLSYGAQRYLGGNADALAAVSDGGRNAGVVYAYDDWTLTPRVSVSYGARYARYDYLSDRALFSPRAGVTLTPRVGDSLKIRATVARRETAPGRRSSFRRQAACRCLPSGRFHRCPATVSSRSGSIRWNWQPNANGWAWLPEFGFSIRQLTIRF